jgi:hypothetical protein
MIEQVFLGFGVIWLAVLVAWLVTEYLDAAVRYWQIRRGR